MNRPTLALLLLTFFLSSCLSPQGGLSPNGGLSPQGSLPATIPPAADTPTVTLIPDTSTPQPPTATPTLSIPTRTPFHGASPLPTIPTFTPTFNARTIVTATPAPKAVCPSPNPDLQLELPNSNRETLGDDKTNYEELVLGFLNQGGTVKQLIFAHETAKNTFFALSGPAPIAKDLTNDGVPEILAVYSNQADDLSNTMLHVFVCENGVYSDKLQVRIGLGSIKTLEFRDINRDNIPEIILNIQALWAEVAGALSVHEWDGINFQSLIYAPYSPAYALIYRRGSIPANTIYQDWITLHGLAGDATFDFKDDNGDGVLEIVATWRHVLYSDGPSRDPELILGWNGEQYLIQRVKYPSPQFRFQAVQDADDDSQFGEFDKALSLYQNVIFDNKLDWYSRQRQDTYGCCNNLTPVSPDLTEYPRLAAYAYYRMVILHTFLGEMDAAQVKYATLQEKFPAGDPGHPYVEMASAFWDAYQSSGKMYDACGAAIQYAAEHPEILTPLGSDYHGAQSHTYVPADVCPFR